MTMTVLIVILSISTVITANSIKVQCDAEEKVCTASYNSEETMLNQSTCLTGMEERIEHLSKQYSTLLAKTNANGETATKLLALLNTLIAQHNDTALSPMPTSCSQIKQRWPNSPSGFYQVIKTAGEVEYIYCHMTELCGSDGPWTRVAYLNMSNPSEECPEGFHEYNENGVRGCGRQTSLVGSCQSTKYQTHNTVYTQVCGRVHGYRYYTPDGAYLSSARSIDTPYMDGISLTYGSPRNHLWTFVSGARSPNSNYFCPCNPNSNQLLPLYVGNDYYCESGLDTPGIKLSNDLLWDGDDCWDQEQEGCCQNSNLPWFHKTINQATSDDIELRVCCNQDTVDEDVPVNYYEIYVK